MNDIIWIVIIILLLAGMFVLVAVNRKKRAAKKRNRVSSIRVNSAAVRHPESKPVVSPEVKQEKRPAAEK